MTTYPVSMPEPPESVASRLIWATIERHRARTCDGCNRAMRLAQEAGSPDWTLAECPRLMGLLDDWGRSREADYAADYPRWLATQQPRLFG